MRLDEEDEVTGRALESAAHASHNFLDAEAGGTTDATLRQAHCATMH